MVAPAAGPLTSLRWRIAIILSVAIAISYLDRQALSIAVAAIQQDIPLTNTFASTARWQDARNFKKLLGEGSSAPDPEPGDADLDPGSVDE